MTFPGSVQAILLEHIQLHLPGLCVRKGNHTAIQCEAHACDGGIRTHAGGGKSINSQRLNFSCTPVCVHPNYFIRRIKVCVICCALLCTITTVEPWSCWGGECENPHHLHWKRLKWPSPLVNGHKCTYNTHCINTTSTCVNSTATTIRRHFTDNNHLLLLFITLLMCYVWQEK